MRLASHKAHRVPNGFHPRRSVPQDGGAIRDPLGSCSVEVMQHVNYKTLRRENACRSRNNGVSSPRAMQSDHCRKPLPVSRRRVAVQPYLLTAALEAELRLMDWKHR